MKQKYQSLIPEPPFRQGASPSRTFGTFDIVAPLGVGGMGEAHLAAWRGGGQFRKLCVLKRLHTHLAPDASARARFDQEARVAARLNHPNVVHTYDAGHVGGVPYLAMEYLEGQTLRNFTLACGTIGIQPDPLLWVRVIADALAGLEHAHGLRDFDGSPLGVIHRDVSPHNIFVTYGGRVALIDFGMLKIASDDGPLPCRTLAGKPRYMAPEYIARGMVDRRADIFSMGVVLWEMLAGQTMPIAEITPEASSRPRPHLGTVVPTIDPALEAIVACAVEVNPELRYPTARAMREALEGYLEIAGPGPRREHVGELLAAYFSDERERTSGIIAKHMESDGEEVADIPSNRWDLRSLGRAQSEDSRVRVFASPFHDDLEPEVCVLDDADVLSDSAISVADAQDVDDAPPVSRERARSRQSIPPELPTRRV